MPRPVPSEERNDLICDHTEHGLRRSGNVWGRYWDAKKQKGVWEVCIAETTAHKEREGICDDRWVDQSERRFDGVLY